MGKHVVTAEFKGSICSSHIMETEILYKIASISKVTALSLFEAAHQLWLREEMSYKCLK